MGFRQDVMNSLGRFPEKLNVEGEVISSESLGNCLLKTVRYNVERNEYIKAYLLIPKGIEGRSPAIIASHQHAGEYFLGKSEPAGLSGNTMYHYGLELCTRGYVVLCPDHLGFEDRRPPELIRMQNSSLDGSNYERFLFCKYILKGSTLQAKYLSDLCRGVDYLQTLDFVDARRIGAIGHSLGGQETLWLTWFDERIKVGVSSCGFSQMKSILRDGINHNLAAYAFGLLNMGDMVDIVCDIAPRPFIITNGTEDRIFPLDGVKEISRMAGERYRKLGMKDKFKSIIFEGGHSFPEEVREETYRWIDKYL